MNAPPPAQTILVVDDDGALRALTCDALETCGYRVLAAANALAAHQISRTFPGRIDLLIADVHMPLMGGFALAEQLRKKRPLRFLFISGDVGAIGAGGGQSLPGKVFLLKPFTLDELRRKVRDVALRPVMTRR